MPRAVNQTPEQIARDRIDDRLREAGWHVQNKNALDFSAGLGIAVREYQTDIGPADYVLFADRQAVGVVEAKPYSWGGQAHDSRIEAALAHAVALRQSILKKAFSGKLIPQEPDDEPALALLSRIRANRDEGSTTKPRRPARRRASTADPP